MHEWSSLKHRNVRSRLSNAVLSDDGEAFAVFDGVVLMASDTNDPPELGSDMLLLVAAASRAADDVLRAIVSAVSGAAAGGVPPTADAGMMVATSANWFSAPNGSFCNTGSVNCASGFELFKVGSVMLAAGSVSLPTLNGNDPLIATVSVLLYM